MSFNAKVSEVMSILFLLMALATMFFDADPSFFTATIVLSVLHAMDSKIEKIKEKNNGE